MQKFVTKEQFAELEAKINLVNTNKEVSSVKAKINDIEYDLRKIRNNLKEEKEFVRLGEKLHITEIERDKFQSKCNTLERELSDMYKNHQKKITFDENQADSKDIETENWNEQSYDETLLK